MRTSKTTITYAERTRPSEEAVRGSQGAKKERNISQPAGSTPPSTGQSRWELLGLRTHPDSPAPEYVCSFVKEMHKAQRPEMRNHAVVPFALFPKGQSLAFSWRWSGATPGGSCPCPRTCLCFFKGRWGTGSLPGGTTNFQLLAALSVLEGQMRKRFYPEFAEAFLKSSFISALNWHYRSRTPSDVPLGLLLVNFSMRWNQPILHRGKMWGAISPARGWLCSV